MDRNRCASSMRVKRVIPEVAEKPPKLRYGTGSSGA